MKLGLDLVSIVEAANGHVAAAVLASLGVERSSAGRAEVPCVAAGRLVCGQRGSGELQVIETNLGPRRNRGSAAFSTGITVAVPGINDIAEGEPRGSAQASAMKVCGHHCGSLS